jgi:predicted PurR-regulated permease PerM
VTTTELTKKRGVWENLSWSLRYGAVASLCLLLVAAAVYVLVRFAVLVAPLTLAVLIALLLAALLEPVTRLIDRLPVPRAVCALVTILALLAVLVLPAVLLWNVTAEQAADLPAQLSQGWDRTRDWLIGVGISQGQLDEITQNLREQVSAGGGNLTATAMGVVEALGSALLALVLLFFLLKDGRAIGRWLAGRFPRRSRDRVVQAGRDGWTALGRYARGTVVVAAVDAIGIGIGLLVIGVPLALPLALLTFVAAFVPIIGATVAGAVAVLVALAANGPVDALLVLAVVVAVQQLEGNLLEPLIMGRALRLHPAVVLVVVSAGALLAGVAGALIAVPITAVVYRAWRSWTDGDADGEADADADADALADPDADAPAGTGGDPGGDPGGEPTPAAKAPAQSAPSR